MSAALDEITNVYNDEKLYLAERKLDEYVATLDTESAYAVENEPIVVQIRKEAKTMRAMLAELFDSDGWTLRKEDKTCRVYYRHDEATPIHSIKMEGEMDCHIFNVLAVVNELDLYKNWVPYMKRSSRCAQSGRARQVGNFEITLPWPVANREATVYGFGADLLDEAGYVAVHCESMLSLDGLVVSAGYEEDSRDLLEAGKLPDIKKGNVAAIVHLGGMVLQPLSESRTMFRIVVNTDPQLALVPYWLINFVTRNFAHWIFHKMRKTALHIEGTEYEKRINTNEKLYGFLRNRLDEFFKKAAVENWHQQDRNEEHDSTQITPETEAAAEDEEDCEYADALEEEPVIGNEPDIGNEPVAIGEARTDGVPI
eukprot:ANDGO_02525.mRNA.1 hypothetical protein SAMD00019534_059680